MLFLFGYMVVGFSKPNAGKTTPGFLFRLGEGPCRLHGARFCFVCILQPRALSGLGISDSPGGSLEPRLGPLPPLHASSCLGLSSSCVGVRTGGTPPVFDHIHFGPLPPTRASAKSGLALLACGGGRAGSFLSALDFSSFGSSSSARSSAQPGPMPSAPDPVQPEASSSLRASARPGLLPPVPGCCGAGAFLPLRASARLDSPTSVPGSARLEPALPTPDPEQLGTSASLRSPSHLGASPLACRLAAFGAPLPLRSSARCGAPLSALTLALGASPPLQSFGRAGAAAAALDLASSGPVPLVRGFNQLGASVLVPVRSPDKQGARCMSACGRE